MKTESIGLRKRMFGGLASIVLATGVAFNIFADEKKTGTEYSIANTGISYDPSEGTVNLPAKIGESTRIIKLKLIKKSDKENSTKNLPKNDQSYETCVMRNDETKITYTFMIPEFLKPVQYDAQLPATEYLIMAKSNADKNGK